MHYFYVNSKGRHTYYNVAIVDRAKVTPFNFNDTKFSILVDFGLTAGATESKTVLSDRPGKIIKILTSRGAIVDKGDRLFEIENMEGRSFIKSDRTGAIESVLVSKGAYLYLD